METIYNLTNNRKSAKEILDDFKKTMEELKPYLPKIPDPKPKLKVEWKKEELGFPPRNLNEPTI